MSFVCVILREKSFLEGAVKMRSLLPVIDCSYFNTVQEVRFDFNIVSLSFGQSQLESQLFSGYLYFLSENILPSFISWAGSLL